jgi:hypothetical protein
MFKVKSCPSNNAASGGCVVRHVLIRAGNVAIRARLLATPTADRIWEALPINASVQTWGKEVYFRTPVSQDIEPDARAVVCKGEIVFWPEGDAISIGFGATPISKRGEIRFTSKCNVWAVALDDVDLLQAVYAGEQVSVEEASDDDRRWMKPPRAVRGRRSMRHAMADEGGGATG